MERLDKVLANLGYGSRKEIKAIVKKGFVTVDGEVVKDSAMQLDPETVVDLLHPDHGVFQPFPVGRLDKDTVGLLLLTNDGELNHRLISPKWHVDKVYFAHIDKLVDDKDVQACLDGVVLDDGYKCLPGKLEILEASEEGSKIKLTIQEGKYHQVKRMFESLGKKVIYLKRISFGGLDLDPDLEEGEYRELTEEELNILKGI